MEVLLCQKLTYQKSLMKTGNILYLFLGLYIQLSQSKQIICKTLLIFVEKKIDDIPLGDGEYIDGSYHIDVDNDEEAIYAQSYLDFGGVTINRDGTIT